MKILIIEDDPSLREMLAITIATRLEPKFRLAGMEDFSRITRYFVGTHTLLLAANLAEGLRMIPEADGALCDGRFPAAAGPISTQSGAPENWRRIADATAIRRIPFVLLSGDEDLLTRAKLQGFAAFAKPMGASSAINRLLAEIERVGTRRSAPVDQDATAA